MRTPLLPSLVLLTLATACAHDAGAPAAAPPAAGSSSQPASTAVVAATAPETAHAEPLQITFASEPDYVAPALGTLRRGINLGNGFDAPTLGAWGVTPVVGHFAMAAAAGFDHMRLPVRFSTRALKEAPYTIEEKFFQKIDWAIEQALAHKLSIIIDLHHYEELMATPEAEMERAVAIWEQVAARYANRPEQVIFELLNEPCKNLSAEKNNELTARLIAAVRKTNPTRWLIVDSFFWAAADQLQHLVLPSDPKVAASFHMYQPILFTHQGTPWMDPEYRTKGIVFPGPGNVPAVPTAAAAATAWSNDWLTQYNTEPAATNPSSVAVVAQQFDLATAYAKKEGRPVYLGEFSAVNVVDPTSRENYLRLVRREAERRGFGWAIWDDGGMNRGMIVGHGTWEKTVVRALFTDQPGQELPNLGAGVE